MHSNEARDCGLQSALCRRIMVLFIDIRVFLHVTCVRLYRDIMSSCNVIRADNVKGWRRAGHMTQVQRHRQDWTDDKLSKRQREAEQDDFTSFH